MVARMGHAFGECAFGSSQAFQTRRDCEAISPAAEKLAVRWPRRAPTTASVPTSCRCRCFGAPKRPPRARDFRRRHLLASGRVMAAQARRRAELSRFRLLSHFEHMRHDMLMIFRGAFHDISSFCSPLRQTLGHISYSSSLYRVRTSTFL